MVDGSLSNVGLYFRRIRLEAYPKIKSHVAYGAVESGREVLSPRR
jgi:hypothetical protein